MRRFSCNCGAKVFFENTRCVACSSELGWCPVCAAIRSIIPNESGEYICGESTCGAVLKKCHNYEINGVCNRCYTVNESTQQSGLCGYCRFNDTIPDLSVDGNHEKWRRIEAAKRRLLYTLDLLGVPYGVADSNYEHPLSFDFKGDVNKKKSLWLFMNNTEQVYTGHYNGKVTINIREADHVEREKARIAFGEAHRTIIGHFRHEMGHYFWDLLVKGKHEAECAELFGDHNNPDYSSALKIYYENGAKSGWQKDYISAYATMHPWEDFAESFAAYLDMISVVDIAFHAQEMYSVNPLSAEFADIVKQHATLGLLLNEMNRAMGLLDLAPSIYTESILRKIEFIHNLMTSAAQRARLAANC